MDVFAVFHRRVAEALKAQFADLEVSLLDRFVVEPPRDPSHGELSTNAAMVVAKPLGVPPRQVAEALAGRLQADPDVAEVEIAGPGFVNLRLRPALWQSLIGKVDALGADFGRADLGHGAKLNVEYVSANPTGPMHVGHMRGAVYGDALAALMEFVGFAVTREYYINDAGAQIDTLARSAFLRYRQALGEEIGEIPEGLYPGDYLIAVGEGLKAKFGDALSGQPEPEWLPVVRPFVVEAMMALIRADLGKLGIRHEHFFSESTLHGPKGGIAETMDWLRAQGLVYEGRLPRPKSGAAEDWEDREQTLFRATEFGDDTDRALLKSDGTFTYFAADIAYHRDKYLRGYHNQLVVLGADHVGYVKRLQAALKAVSGGAAEIDVKLCQLVHLMRAGSPVKMSKRTGAIVTVADVVDEVGPDAVRFIMLYRKNDAPLDFDFDLVTQKSRDNPVFYVQYAHARCCSVFRTADRDLPDLDHGPGALGAADLTLLDSPEDLALLRLVAAFPRTVESAAHAHEPHRVAFYLHDLAAEFHAFWTKGNESERLRFVNPNERKLTLARLAMVKTVRQVLRNGLGILGVTAPAELS